MYVAKNNLNILKEIVKKEEEIITLLGKNNMARIFNSYVYQIIFAFETSLSEYDDIKSDEYLPVFEKICDFLNSKIQIDDCLEEIQTLLKE